MKRENIINISCILVFLIKKKIKLCLSNGTDLSWALSFRMFKEESNIGTKTSLFLKILTQKILYLQEQNIQIWMTLNILYTISNLFKIKETKLRNKFFEIL